MTDQPADAAPSQTIGGPVVDSPPEHGGVPHHAHPTELEYVKVAILLAIITLAEVAIYYVPSLEGLLVPILLVFSTIKFAVVVLWFMHLRFDSRLFRRLFVTGLALAGFVYSIVLSTFHFWTR